MCKQALLEGKKLAEKALKRLQAKKKSEDCKKNVSRRKLRPWRRPR